MAAPPGTLPPQKRNCRLIVTTPRSFSDHISGFRTVRRVRRAIARLERHRAQLDPRSLVHHGMKITSQNDEDGMIAEALRRLGVHTPRFVEIGASNGRENCTRQVLENGGVGLWVEGNAELVEQARSLAPPHRLDVRSAFVTKDNIVAIIEQSNLVRDGFDLLVVDIDGNDWWVMREILRSYTPRLVVAEYAKEFGPTRRWVMPYDENFSWNMVDLAGASLTSYDDLMCEFGYRLVACESNRVNGFWVRADDVHLFTDTVNPQDHFPPLNFRIATLEPNAAAVTRPVELDAIRVTGCRRVESSSQMFDVSIIDLHNGTSQAISSRGTVIANVGYRFRHDDPNREPRRVKIRTTIKPGRTGHVFVQGTRDQIISWANVVLEGEGWGHHPLAL